MDKIFLNSPGASGIYEIRNIQNGKVYIGQAARLNARAQQHENALKLNKHSNKHLQAAWNLYGPSAFRFTVLLEIKDKEEKDVAEQLLINQVFGNQCYNVQKEVRAARKIWSSTPEETKKKLSESRKDWKHSEESKAKTSASMRGKNVGRVKSPETRAKMSEVMRKRWAAKKA
jgi:group I intron endonuclease